MNCPKCGSLNTYFAGGMNACRMCGWRGLPGNIKPYDVRHGCGQNKEEEIMAERGKCDNCERDNVYIVAHGVCGGCYTALRQYGWGTPECEAALAEAKKRFTDPNYKRGGKKKNAPDKRATGKKTGISKVTATDAAIIEHLKEQRDEHLATAKKLDQAIECLS